MTSTTLVARVFIEVHPRPGQTPEQAANEIAGILDDYLTRQGGPFQEDYGATLEDIEYAKEHDDYSQWHGYEGPFATYINVNTLENEND